MSNALSLALADSLIRLVPPGQAAADNTATAKAAVIALAEALERGELGLDLNGPPADGLEEMAWPKGVVKGLKACGWLISADALDDAPEAPIVQDGHWLRWRRWHLHLHRCLEQLLELGSTALPRALTEHQRDTARTAAKKAGLDGQQTQAVLALLHHRLVLLTGGPGTGKTSTVVQMLAAALTCNPAIQIHLAAPTGKAAARLQQAVTTGSRALKSNATQQLSTLPCSTLHRLLEAQGENRFRRNRNLPLTVDLLVVDEVSMVDLPLMEALLEALPDHAQLLLIGDPDQLPPVGPGAVLQELHQPQTRQRLGPAAVELQTTYRNNGAIAALAHHLRGSCSEGSSGVSKALLTQLQTGDNVEWLEAKRQGLPKLLLQELRAHQNQLSALATACAGRTINPTLRMQLRCWTDWRPGSPSAPSAKAPGGWTVSTAPFWGNAVCDLCSTGPQAHRCSTATTEPTRDWPMATSVSWCSRISRPACCFQGHGCCTQPS